MVTDASAAPRVLAQLVYDRWDLPHALATLCHDNFLVITTSLWRGDSSLYESPFFLLERPWLSISYPEYRLLKSLASASGIYI